MHQQDNRNCRVQLDCASSNPNTISLPESDYLRRKHSLHVNNVNIVKTVKIVKNVKM